MGRLNIANNAPKYTILAGSNTTGNGVYANTTESAFIHNTVVDLFGVPGANSNSNSAHAGWIVETLGSGPVKAFNVANGGISYTNTDYVTVSNGSINAYGLITTNATGGIISVAMGNSAGGGFVNNSISTVTITSSSNTAAGGVITVTLGGRANRKQYEVLVAASSITSNSTGAVPI